MKVLNPERSAEYLVAIGRSGPAWDRAFEYSREDLRVLHLTRRLAALGIERPDDQAVFGSDPVRDFAREFDVLEAEGLVHIGDNSIETTIRGMFHADSIAGLLSPRQLRARRLLQELDSERRNDNGPGHM